MPMIAFSDRVWFASRAMSGGFERDDSPESVVDAEPLRLCPKGPCGPEGFQVPGLGGEESREALCVPDGQKQEVGEYSDAA